MNIYVNSGVELNEAYDANGIKTTILFDSNGVNLDNDMPDYSVYSISQYCQASIAYMQGFAIYDNVIFQFRASTAAGIENYMCIVNPATGRVERWDIDCVSGHGDSASFSNEFYNPNDKFPLLYVSADTNPCKVYVNRVTETTSELIKTYLFPLEKVGYYAAHAYDKDNQIMYLVGYSEENFTSDDGGNNKTVVSKWDMRHLTENQDGSFTPQFISSYQRPFIFVTQGQDFHDGMIWIASGYPSGRNSFVYAMNPATGEFEYTYDLGTTEEVEGVYFIERNKLVVGLYGGDYRLYTFG